MYRTSSAVYNKGWKSDVAGYGGKKKKAFVDKQFWNSLEQVRFCQ